MAASDKKPTVKPVDAPVSSTPVEVDVQLVDGIDSNTMYFLQSGRVSFVDGKARVSSAVADDLKKLGVLR